MRTWHSNIEEHDVKVDEMMFELLDQYFSELIVMWHRIEYASEGKESGTIWSVRHTKITIHQRLLEWQVDNTSEPHSKSVNL